MLTTPPTPNVWGAFVAAAGKRYNGHPAVNTIDISTVGYWGEGWGPYLPEWSVQQRLMDQYFEAFDRTRLLMNFDEPRALAYGTQKGAGWRLDCWGDLGGRGRNMMHMLDLYPQQVVRTGIEEVWRRSPVSLETCGTPLSWKQWNYTDKQLQYIFDQALRWHASSINIKSTAIPPEWKPAFREFEKKIGYRFTLRRLEYPSSARAGSDDACQHVVAECRCRADLRRVLAGDADRRRGCARTRGSPQVAPWRCRLRWLALSSLRR